MKGAAYIGIAALLVCAVLVLTQSAGVDTNVVDRTTSWIIFLVLIGIAAVWIGVLAADAVRSRRPSAAEEAAAEAAAAAFPDDVDLAEVDRRSRLAHLRLTRLADLRDQGAISEHDFESKKAEILREI